MRRIENVIPCKHLGGDGLCDIGKYGHCLIYKRAYQQRRYHGEPEYKAAHLENFTHRYHHDAEFREDRLDQHRKYYVENAERLKENERKRRANDPERVRAYNQRYYLENAERLRKQERDRRAKARGQNGAAKEGQTK